MPPSDGREQSQPATICQPTYNRPNYQFKKRQMIPPQVTHAMNKRLMSQVSSINTVNMSFFDAVPRRLAPKRLQERTMTRSSSLCDVQVLR